MITSKKSLCIVTFPVTQGANADLVNILRLTSPLMDQIYLISNRIPLKNFPQTAKKVTLYEISHARRKAIFGRVITYMQTQIKIFLAICSASSRTDLFIFLFSGETLLPCVLFLKLRRKKVVLKPGGAVDEVANAQRDLLLQLLQKLTRPTLFLADEIMLYSKHLAKKGMYKGYESKTLIINEQFIDFHVLGPRLPIGHRPNVVGFVGRLSEEKGAIQFVESIPRILDAEPSVKFSICGDGALLEKIRKIIDREKLSQNVDLLGWIPRDEVFNVMRSFKILALPSKTEGSPKVMLEAMATGTPVLATNVGGISEVIVESSTGFLLESNEPTNIASQVIFLLRRPELLEAVSQRAFEYVRNEFAQEKRFEVWRKALSKFASVAEIVL